MYDRLERLDQLGLVTSVLHNAGPSKTEYGRKRNSHRKRQRFFPTVDGIKEAADYQDMEPPEYWRDLPVHPQVFRELIPRLDALAVIYSLAALIIRHSAYGSATVDHHINVKESPYDAVIRLENGPAIGVVRAGRRQTSTSFRARWNAIVRDKDRWPSAVLILTATPTAWRHAYAIVAAREGPPVYCAQEDQTLESTGRMRRTWGEPTRPGVFVSMADIARRLPSKPGPSPAAPSRRGTMGIDQYPATLPISSPAVCLTPAEKGLLDVIDDWHLVRRSFLSGLAGVSSARVSQMLPSLIAQGLVALPCLEGNLYYALSNEGLKYIAGRDRVTLPVGTWSVELRGPTGILGGKMRSLFRELDHTETVSWLMSDLAREVRELEDYRLSDLDPPERALIRPNHISERTGIEPDAGGRIRYADDDGTRWVSFVLEYERGSINERRASHKVRLYQTFFNSGHRWGLDGPPLVLFVFDTPADELRFFDVATRLDNDELRDIPVPFALSNLEELKATGFIGYSWLVPEEGGENYRLPLTGVRANQRWSRVTDY